VQNKVKADDPIPPGEYGRDMMRLIIGKGVVAEPLLCGLCKLLGKDICPHKCMKGCDPPTEAVGCDRFLVNAATYGQLDALVQNHFQPKFAA
jgi:hypothetical protein